MKKQAKKHQGKQARSQEPFNAHQLLLPMLAGMRGFKVVEIPVRHRPRKHGESKYGVWNRVFKGLRDLRTIRWMQRTKMTYRVEPRGSESGDEGAA